MPVKLPLRFGSTKVKSPAPKARQSRLSAASPTRPSSSRRSRSHDPDRRPSDASSSRYPPSSSGRARRRSPSASPPPSRHDRRRRRDSSSSPERYHSSRRDERYDRGRRHDDDDARDRRRQSLAVERDRDEYTRRNRPSSVDYRHTSSRVNPGAAPGAFNREGENDPRNDRRRRSHTPDKYKSGKDKRTRPSRSPSPPLRNPPVVSKPKPESPAQAASSSASSALLSSMPSAVAAYAGLKTISKHAESAKEWINWLSELSETPEEIQELSAKATTARDTINQVQQTLKARPDLLEGDEAGEMLKEQIEDQIKSTDKALVKMTKMLSEISKHGADHGNVVNGMQDFWRSYRYKDEFEDQVKMADEEVQQELTGLSTLMVNLYSRALIKPAPPGSGTIPPPVPTKEASEPTKMAAAQPEEESNKVGVPSSEPEKVAKVVRLESPRPEATTVRTEPVPHIVDPSISDKQTKGASTIPDTYVELPHPPPSPSTVGREEAKIGSPPILITEPTRTESAASSIKESSDLGSKAKANPPPSSTPTTEYIPTLDSKSKHDEQPEPTASPEDTLLDAAWDGDLSATARALRHASPRTCDDSGRTPLHLASERDKLAVAMLLLDRGAEITARSDGGRTPLHLAARSATAPMVEMLLERGKADPNTETARGRTPLHYAASKAADGDEERREVLRVLRDFGADPTVQDREGETARDVAQKREHWDAASTLRRAEKRWEEDHKQGWLQRHGFLK